MMNGVDDAVAENTDEHDEKVTYILLFICPFIGQNTNQLFKKDGTSARANHCSTTGACFIGC